MYDRALAGREKALGPDHTNTLNTTYNLGALLKKQGKFKEAKVLYQRCYDGYAKIYGATHSETLDAEAQVDRLSYFLSI